MVLVGKLQTERQLARFRCRWDNIKSDLKRADWGVWTGLLRIRIGKISRLLLTNEKPT
jgi:hypothetical protein